MANSQTLASFIWSIADTLRSTYKEKEYGDVILPFTILRRFDCLLEPTRQQVRDAYLDKRDAYSESALDALLKTRSGLTFYCTSEFDLRKLLADPENIRQNLLNYIEGLSPNVRDIFTLFELPKTITKLATKNLLFRVVSQFAAVDLHPDTVSNIEMGTLFEELIRRFSESTDSPGEHFTPREVIRLMVDLLFAPDDDALTTPGVVRSIYDPTAGTGGMLSVADEYLRTLNPQARLSMAGQEINDQSYAICKADMVIKGQEVSAIRNGDTLRDDLHEDRTFNYVLSNPPFGVDWKEIKQDVEDEHLKLGMNGRFGPGLPRVSDGSLLFLLHVLSKLRPVDETATEESKKGGGRAGIVLNGSPLFTGGAGSGESEIRRYVIENDLLEAIVALPTDMFYNTGISTYVWILTNRKAEERKGTVQLIDGSGFWEKMPKSLGSKRKTLSEGHIADIVKLYGEYADADPEVSKVLRNENFGYRAITVERPLRLNFSVAPERVEVALSQKALEKLPEETLTALRAALATLDDMGKVWKDRDDFIAELTPAVLKPVKLSTPQFKALWQGLSERDETASVCTDRKGTPEADGDLRDTENVPLTEDVDEYFAREVLPFAPDAWIDRSKTKIGYEIPFTRLFYKYVEPRSLEEIDADLENVLGRIRARLARLEEVSA
ncbi:restriction endonuclease subunit M [Sinomonas atrocyanea]|uniref:site-specific DNA-methyltransferase (adenine-specific) n=1 Tax=Sinomonas atrocyanea TaxID=37927 RepID=A0A126ZVN2_9MICC|nr:class I SAM-dependent DNA methyltransferase [Sinomonas atrocyanea]AMM31007.1 restriction endonuclease subunit M [Sinomonas atrocyanea]GEB63250.1 type I restriction endonuclease subunit M [Sinomonas atrocyanea]GGG69658.1 type I restriction endonuclease subunit M [Sinomonas atrocyanea]